jgi:hypothetical protein
VIWRIAILGFSFLVACGGDENSSWVDRQHAENLASFSDDADLLLQRGLLADRKHNYIDVLAHASGVDENTPVDIILTSRDSESTNYLARAEVSADELQAALEFIGLSPGHPIDAANLLYWPKGERVTVEFAWDADNDGRFETFAMAEQLIIDRNWDSELPELGFRYVGPASDVEAVTEIVMANNAGNTLFEVSYTVSKDNVADRTGVNPAYLFASNQALRIRLRPEFRGDRRRVKDYRLDVEMGDGNDAGKLPNLKVRLSDGRNADDFVVGGLEDVFVYLKDAIEEGEEPFIQIHFSDAVAAASVRDVAMFASQFLIEQQIRFEPNASQPYISAFLPNAAWRDPEQRGRSSQPLEIHLLDGGASGELFQFNNTGAVDKHYFSSLAELDDALKNGGPWQTDGVFLFVAPDTAFGRINNVFQMVKNQYSNFYVFP